MEDTQRVRIIILGLSGLLLAAGGGGWVWYNQQKAEQAAMDEELTTPTTVNRPNPIRPTGSSTGGEPFPGDEPTVPATKLASNPPSAPAGTGTTPATGSTATAPTATTPTTPAGTQPTQTPTQTPGAQPAATSSKPATTTSPATTVNPSAATQPQTTPAVKLAAQPAKPPAPAPVAQPAPQTQPAPVAKAPVAKPPVAPAAAPTTVASNSLPGIAPASVPAADPTTSAPAPEGKYAAITVDHATQDANTGAGRSDPMQPVTSFQPFPRGKKAKPDALAALVPPPPPSKTPPPPPKINEKLIPPPPPPGEMPGAGGMGLPIAQLPVPPSRPTIGDKMKVIAVLDDKAMMTFPTKMRLKNKWPKVLTLGAGEQFESISVVSVNKDGVTIEEDGERTVKAVEPVR
jgi:hypothetical protein